MVNDVSVLAVIRAARPSFKNNHDKLAFAVHASFLASGYVLIATGPPAFSSTALSSSSNDEVGIDGWNDVAGEYAFLYLSPDKGGKKVLVKCLAMDGKLFVNALADGAKEPVHAEIDVNKYVEENGGTNSAEQFKNLDKIIRKLDDEVLSKVVGSYSDSSKPATSTVVPPAGLEGNYRSRPDIDAYGIEIDEPTGPPVYTSGMVYPPVAPFGGSDVFPGPGAGMYPVRSDFGHGGGMLLGPRDPRWSGGVGGQLGFPGGHPGVPPGARFDPYGPSGVPGFEPHRFGRNQPRPGRGTHPDLEHFGSGSDFI